MCPMRAITIRELHEKTGEWVRRSEELGPITGTTTKPWSWVQISLAPVSTAVSAIWRAKIRGTWVPPG